MTSPMRDALEQLNDEIKLGGEFPDAAYQAAKAWGVDQDKLEQAYDAQFEDGGRRA
jgi:hypothetical protein